MTGVENHCSKILALASKQIPHQSTTTFADRSYFGFLAFCWLHDCFMQPLIRKCSCSPICINSVLMFLALMIHIISCCWMINYFVTSRCSAVLLRKGAVYPKMKSAIIYLPSYCSKPLMVLLYQWNIKWVVEKNFQADLFRTTKVNENWAWTWTF